MDKIVPAEPAKYPKTSIGESEAIAVLEYIICHRNVKPHLEKMDKYPNTDGYLEITKDNQAPIGKLEVQVRKLPDSRLDPPKCQCELEFLGYCQQAPLPVLLIGVDIENSVAYWRHVNRAFLQKLNLRSEAKSVTVETPRENVIKKDGLDYLPRWEEIILDHRIRVHGYDILKEKYESLQESLSLLSEKSEPTLGLGKKEFIDHRIRMHEYDILKGKYESLQESHSLLLEKSEPTLGLGKKEFIEIHKFLDFLNTELDSNFRIIKSIFFKDCWKIGLAYFNYTTDEVSYVLYPISYDTNDVQIRKMSESLRDEFRQQGLTFTGHYTENPISIRAKDYALEIIHSRLRRVFENQLLPIRNIILAREFIFSFIEQFHIPLGLEIKDKYGLEEIRSAFFRYLPVWIEESLKNERISPGRKGFIDPSLILCQMPDDERKEIAKRIEARLLKGEYSNRIFRLGNDKYPLRLLVMLLDNLKSNGTNEIRRLYIPKNYKRAKGFIWSLFSPEDVRKNIEIFFGHLPKVYDSVVDDYFSSLKPELLFFRNFDRLVVVIDAKEEYKNWQDSPSIECFYLKNTQKKESIVNVYMKSDRNVPIDGSVQFGSDIVIDGNTYQLLVHSSAILDFIYHDLPMLEYVYDLLDRRFRSFFKEKWPS